MNAPNLLMDATLAALARPLNKPMPRVPLSIEFLGRMREIMVEIDYAPPDRAVDYAGWLNVTRAWMGDTEITDVLSKADFEELLAMVKERR